jgi:hypothetical protein
MIAVWLRLQPQATAASADIGKGMERDPACDRMREVIVEES